MCAHYESVKDTQRFEHAFGLPLPSGAKVDVWPGYHSVFIRRPKDAGLEAGADGNPGADREATVGSFGLIPHWAKDMSGAKRTYNARSETVATKPSYRDAWRLGRRCIIPAEAIYEPDWRTGRAVATRIARADGQPMGIAGIWAAWRSPTGEIVRSMSMLTVNADDHPLMKQFHRPEDEKRMVVILPEADYADWLGHPPGQSERFLRQMPASMLTTG